MYVFGKIKQMQDDGDFDVAVLDWKGGGWQERLGT
jgi:hypothetical protein